MEKKVENEKFPDEISSKYEIIQEIGRGAFSIVYKVKSKEDNNIYCLKKINMKKTKDKESEIKILSNLNHPNLIKFYYSFANEEGIYIIMEFCEYGDLYSLLQSVKKKKVYVNEDIIWDVAIQTLLGLEYLHSKQIIHRDIKLLNLFMTKDKKIKIGDMGMSVHVEEGEMIISRVGTPLYIAPELVKKEKYDYKIDIWSFGCSLYHLAKTSPPFNDENLIKLGNSIINEQPAHLPSCYSSKLYEFILLLMTKNKNKRPSAHEALKLIPDKIKNKLNNKLLDSNSKNIIKSGSKDGHLVIKNKNISNNNDSKNDSNSISNSNNNDRNSSTKNSMKIIEKNNENINLNNKMNKGLVSGQTFYQFFKNNPDKKKNGNYFGINNIDSNNNNNLFLQTKNHNIKDFINKIKINNNDFLLSKTMIQMKDNFYKIKTPGKLNVYINDSSNNQINKSLNNIKIINHSNSKLYKNNEPIKNIEEDKKEYSNVNTYINTNEESNSNTNTNKLVEKESNKKISNINLKKDINPNKIQKEDELNNILIKKEDENNEKIKNGNDRYNIQMFNQKVDNSFNSNLNNININKISMKYNKFDNYLRNNNIKEKGGGFDLYSKSIHNAMKTFLIKDSINDKNKIINSMQFYKNRKYISNNSSLKRNEYNLDNLSNENNYNKEDIIFPLIIQPQNNYKNKNNSTNNKYKRAPGLHNNFRKTVNSHNFRNKLTIHDLK